MKRAIVKLRDVKAGILAENENGYTFLYDKSFLASSKAEAISLTLPLSDKLYTDKVLFPFFDGLIPEGWLLEMEFISISFIPDVMKQCYKDFINNRLSAL